ncbi:hypothetical protein MKW92_051508 [Papaver armeniacum]|nr:hypothetical protein MKW92_051508 [Papaver armeniacum]
MLAILIITMEKPSFIGFLLFAIIGLSLQMQSGTAISCDLGETITTAKVSDGDGCRKELRTNCALQGRVVSQLELNAWDPKKTNEKTCEGCCRVQPGPVAPLPAWWGVCAVTDINKSFTFPNYSGNDCRRCHDGCKPRCDAVGARVGDQICGYFTNGKTNVGLNCICCCRKQVPYPPPPPPSPPPPSLLHRPHLPHPHHLLHHPHLHHPHHLLHHPHLPHPHHLLHRPHLPHHHHHRPHHLQGICVMLVINIHRSHITALRIAVYVKMIVKRNVQQLQ